MFLPDPDVIPMLTRALPWYALKVRTSAEPKLSSALSRKGYDVFLPTHLECRRYSDRVKKVHAALFPGYLFCRVDMNNRLPLLTTPGVDCIVGTRGVAEAISDEEIDRIRRIAIATTAVPWPYLEVGDPVRIEFGSLAGIEGFLTRVRGADRLVVSVHLLQRSIAVEIDRSWVRPMKAEVERRVTAIAG